MTQVSFVDIQTHVAVARATQPCYCTVLYCTWFDRVGQQILNVKKPIVSFSKEIARLAGRPPRRILHAFEKRKRSHACSLTWLMTQPFRLIV